MRLQLRVLRALPHHWLLKYQQTSEKAMVVLESPCWMRHAFGMSPRFCAATKRSTHCVLVGPAFPILLAKSWAVMTSSSPLGLRVEKPMKTRQASWSFGVIQCRRTLAGNSGVLVGDLMSPGLAASQLLPPSRASATPCTRKGASGLPPKSAVPRGVGGEKCSVRVTLPRLLSEACAFFTSSRRRSFSKMRLEQAWLILVSS